MAADAFFEVLEVTDDGLVARATPHAVGPWDPGALHGGPPSALVASAMQATHPPGDRVPTRMSVEILRPVPLGVLRVATAVRRPGRKVDLLTATVATEDGTEVMSAALWRIRRAELPIGVGIEGQRVRGPEGISPSTTSFRGVASGGYLDAMEVRFVAGEWAEPGPAVAWMRQRVALRDDGPTTPLERALVAADSGNGVSSRAGGAGLGAAAVFVNVDLGVHLTREPSGEWICLDASTTLTDHGVGLATTTLHDLDGPFGRGAQSLLVDPGS